MNFLQDGFATIAALDLDPIKVKLMHKESGEGWSLEKANAVEFEYRRYLYLMKKFPNEQAAPSVDVDTFWHYHILDTLKYAEDCQAVFGYFLHHFPYLGLRGEEDLLAHERVGERMRVLYEDTFGEAYRSSATEDSEESPSAAANSAYSLRPPPGAAYSLRPPGITSQVRATDTAYSLTPGTAVAARIPGTAYSLTPGVTNSSKSGSAYSLTPGSANESSSDLFSTRPRLPVQAVN
jgi:hypothetical protein